MLILSRKVGESLIINDNVEIKILEMSHHRIRIGIIAPKEVVVMRKEVLDQKSSTHNPSEPVQES